MEGPLEGLPMLPRPVPSLAVLLGNPEPPRNRQAPPPVSPRMRALLAAASLAAFALAAAPLASADIPPVDCIAIYQPIVEGPPVTIALTSGCSAKVELCERSLGEALETENPLDCL